MKEPQEPREPLRLLRTFCNDPAVDVALDEAVLLAVDSGAVPSTVRLWWPRRLSVVMGIGATAAEEVDIERVKADEVPLIRRHSGGGTVVHAKGMMIYALCLRRELSAELEQISSAHNFLCRYVTEALAGLGLKADAEGLSDIAIGAKKISGNAQARKKNAVLMHGTLLVEADTAVLSRYLRKPPKPPKYRAGRAHEEFMTTLTDSGLRAGNDKIEAAFVEALPFAVAESTLSAGEEADCRRLVAEKYSLDRWTFRK